MHSRRIDEDATMPVSSRHNFNAALCKYLPRHIVTLLRMWANWLTGSTCLHTRSVALFETFCAVTPTSISIWSWRVMG